MHGQNHIKFVRLFSFIKTTKESVIKHKERLN